jgi:hypothetical protein
MKVCLETVRFWRRVLTLKLRHIARDAALMMTFTIVFARYIQKSARNVAITLDIMSGIVH